MRAKMALVRTNQGRALAKRMFTEWRWEYRARCAEETYLRSLASQTLVTWRARLTLVRASEVKAIKFNEERARREGLVRCWVVWRRGVEERVREGVVRGAVEGRVVRGVWGVWRGRK